MNAPPSKPRAAVETMRAHIEWLVEPIRSKQPDLRIEIAWSDADGAVREAQTFRLDEIDDAVRIAVRINEQARNVYIGAILKRANTPNQGRTKGAHSALATALAIDIDVDWHEAATKLDTFIEPAIVVRTGAVPEQRFQIWVRVKPTDDLAAFDALAKRVVACVGADENATGLNRVMRLAGSVSYPPPKKQARGYIIEHTKIKFLDAPTYSLDDLIKKFPETKRDGRSAVAANTAVSDGLGAQVCLPTPPHAEEMRTMLKHLHGAGYFAKRNEWRNAGMALKIAYGDQVGQDLWAETHEDDRARTDSRVQWESFAPEAQPGHVTLGTIIKAAKDAGFPFADERDSAPNRDEGVTLDDFHGYMPTHTYIFVPTREMWPAISVNSRISPVPLIGKDGAPMLDDKGNQKFQSASQWLDNNRPVEQMTWAPGYPMLIADRLMANGGWIARHGVKCFNLFRPPILQSGGDADLAGPWLDHIHKVFPAEAKHIVSWLAHRVQKPQEKINHALVLGGAQGIGKDTLLEPVKRAVGDWNFEEASPRQMFGRFNGFLKSVILRVSEARDLGDVDRFQFYDHMKTYTASPPDVLRVDEKHLREYYVLNCCGVIITTNHKTDGIYLPADDRRHYVAWSEATKEDFPPEYSSRLWAWFERGGYAHVAAFLAKIDISSFDAKAPPPKTAAFWEIADANRAPEDAELADVIDRLGNPSALTLSMIEAATGADFEFGTWIRDRKNRRAIPHRLEKCGYVPVRNDADKSDGQWKVAGKRVMIYAKKALSLKERLRAAAALTTGAR